MQSSLNIRAVAFDMDGLMFNTEDLYTEAGTLVLQRRNRQPSRLLFDQMMGQPSSFALQLMIDHFGLEDSTATLAQEMTSIFEEMLPTRLATMPGLMELLAALEAAAIPKAIGTGSSRAFVRKALAISGLASRFEFVVTSEDVRRGKPHPDTFESIGQRLGVAPRELLVLEDSHHGCRAGLAAGATVVAVPCQHSRHHDFSGVHLVADSLSDPRLLELLFGRREPPIDGYDRG